MLCFHYCMLNLYSVFYKLIPIHGVAVSVNYIVTQIEIEQVEQVRNCHVNCHQTNIRFFYDFYS